MTDVPSGLADPPEDLRKLEQFPAADSVEELHRLSEWPGVWWYATVNRVEDHDGGRFDLTRPRGTCHLAETFDGAVVEKLLRTRTKVVVAERLQELFHASVTVRATPPTADLTAPGATGFGLNAEIHGTLNYTVPRRWAESLYRAGWRALRHRLRGDVSQRLAGRALFGTSGLHARAPVGMTTALQALDLSQAERVLAARGVVVRPIPAQVPTVRAEV